MTATTRERCPASKTRAPGQFSGTCPLCDRQVGTTALGEIETHLVEQLVVDYSKYRGRHRRSASPRS